MYAHFLMLCGWKLLVHKHHICYKLDVIRTLLIGASCEFQTLKFFPARHLNIMRRVESYGPGPSSAYAGSSSLVSVLTLENPFGRSLCIEDGICKINTGTLANTYQGLGYSWHPSVMAYVSVNGNVLRKFPDPSIVSSVKSSLSAWL